MASVSPPSESSTDPKQQQKHSRNAPSLPSLIYLTLPPLISFILYETLQIHRLLPTLSVLILSILSFFLVRYFISAMSPLFINASMYGTDICKRGTPAGEIPIPEPLGLISAAFYIIILCLLHIIAHYNGSATLYTAAMACVTFMTLLGFADDVLDLKWRYKLVLPLVASLPLLVNYSGKTTVVLPRLISPLVAFIASFLGGGIVPSASGRLVDLGAAYYLYMALLSIFCTNAINIYAGINGLEAGQSLIIAVFIALHNTFNLRPTLPKDNLQLLRQHHAFSLDMMMPFIAVTLALLCHNWYPSRVFVGDTFCYFAGMTFAMASILGHFSTTLLLLFIPQIVNFLYSLPQLLGFVHCARHRLPRFDKTTGLLYGQKEHMNMVNLVLRVLGPMNERHLCMVLLALQVVCCAAGLGARELYLKFLS